MAKGKKAAAKAVKSTLEDKVEVLPEVVELAPEIVKDFESVTVESKGEQYFTDHVVTIPEVVTPEEPIIESIYDEDIEVLPPSEPIPAEGKEWVANASLLRKVEGYRDTLNGTLYLGVRK